MVSSVDLLPAGKLSGEVPRDCPCGWGGRYASEPRHATQHLAWATGAPIPTPLSWPEHTIAVVRTTAPAAWRRLAYQLARLAQREGRYDFATFPYLSGRGEDDKEHTRALLYQADGRVVGYLAVGDLPTHGRWDFKARDVSPGEDRSVRPTVYLVFTALHWRRLGIAGQLVNAAAAHAGVPVTELAWSTPFSEGGKALARSFAGPDGGVRIA